MRRQFIHFFGYYVAIQIYKLHRRHAIGFSDVLKVHGVELSSLLGYGSKEEMRKVGAKKPEKIITERHTLTVQRELLDIRVIFQAKRADLLGEFRAGWANFTLESFDKVLNLPAVVKGTHQDRKAQEERHIRFQVSLWDEIEHAAQELCLVTKLGFH